LVGNRLRHNVIWISTLTHTKSCLGVAWLI
jgi:hypothetical protein